MTDTLPQSMPESQQKNSPVSSDVVSPHPSKSNKNLWIISGVAISILCCFSIIGLAAIESGIFSTNMIGPDKFATEFATEKAPIESVLDSYMKYMVAKDAESAYALFSPRAQRQINISKIQEMLDSSNYILFEGYQSLSVYSLSNGVSVNINPDAPQGIVTRVAGIITYQNDIQRTFTCTLEKVNRKWQINDVAITLLPSKTK